ncbi:MAG TPA: hypothetical protein VNS55_03315 [Nocardioides sp.]|nr:hypothetical protein [Nocardioides sp.]
MPTARSWTEWRDAVADLGHLLRFRAATVRRRRTTAVAGAVLLALTAGSAVVPAWVDRAPEEVDRVAGLLPAYLLALVALSVTTAVASGGGREVLARDAAAVHPVSPLTDHLGALVLAPLSAAWLLQTWFLLGAVALVVGPHPGRLAAAQSVALLWVACATACGQVVGWLGEWLRRGPRGVLVVRSLIGAVLLVVGAVGLLPDLRTGLVAGPARWTAEVLRGDGPAALAVVLLAPALAVLVVAGGYAARLAARRVPRDESRLESRSYPARPSAASDLAALVRTDRGSIWRSVPVRRGTVFLALAPGVVALAYPLTWNTLVILPGLVVSGCVLLFGVNVWALDGRGLLWRETLPVSPDVTLLARGWVLAELLLGAGLVTVVLGAVRAGLPAGAELVAVGAALVVVTGQALSGGLRWSMGSPYAVDLRSARATPAPPLVMVGYSTRLALATTATSLLLAAFAEAGRPDRVLVAAAVLLAWSAVRIAGVRRRWRDPVQRARVVATVTA